MLKLESLFLPGVFINNLHKLFVKIAILVSILYSLLMLISCYLDIGITKGCCRLNKVPINKSGFVLWLLQPKFISRVNKNKATWKLLPLRKFVFDFHQWLHFHTHLLAKVALGLFIVQLQRLNYYSPTFLIGLFAFLIWGLVLVIEEMTHKPDNIQQMLQVAQNKFYRIFDTNILGIVSGNLHGTIQQANEEFLQMTGDFPEELISGKITRMEPTPTNHILQDKQSIAQAKTKSTRQSDEKQLLRKDDSLIPILCNCGALSKMQPDIIPCILDLSGRQQLKMASQQEKPKLKLLAELTKDINCCPNPVVILENCFAKLAPEIGLDIYWNYLVENKSPVMHLKSYSGISPTLAQSIEYLKIDQSACGDVTKSLSTIVLENVQQSTEPRTAFIRSVGIRAYYSQALAMEGKLLGNIVFASCSRSQFSESELLLMEAVIDRIAMNIEKTALTNSLQKQAEQLRDTNRIRDEFLSILSHELRSPLQSILGWAQLLRSRTLNPTQVSKGIEAIERNAKAQTQIVEDLLDISRMIKGKLRLNIHTCDLVPILQTVLENVKLAAEVKGINFSYSIDWGQQNYGQQPHLKQISQSNQATKLLCSTYTNFKFLVCGDPERLQQIIWNLLSNAIKFTPNGGRVEIFLSRVQDQNQPADSPLSSYAQIQVKDTGVGIDSHLIPYVFDRFYQTDSSNTRLHGGMGLGLAIVHHLVDLHGGTIEVESPGVGKGAIFTVKLPLFDIQLQPMEKKKEVVTFAGYRRLGYHLSQEKISLLPSTLLQGVRVLIVNSEVELQDFFVAVLESYQAQVQVLSSNIEALNTIEECKPDVLICDIETSQEDGYSLINELRSRENRGKQTKIPAVALTADGAAEQRIRAIHEGYQIYLIKPVELCELVTVVACLAGRTEELRASNK